MIYIKNDSTSPFFNFALEYYLLTQKQLDDDIYLLLWRTNPTLMIGKFQNTIEEINQKYVDENNINVVRRISGGGCIYTDLNTWQYSVINKNCKNRNIDFEKFTTPVINALKELNIDAHFNNRNDLLIGNKKFSGNAQCIKENSMVHHGSILFNTDIEQMVKSITVSQDKIISKGIKSIRERVTNISEHLKIPMTNLEFREVILKHLLDENSSVYELTQDDLVSIKEIEDTMFNTWQWNYSKSPKFNIKKSNRYSGGKLEINIDVAKGLINNIKINGDFFANNDIEELESKLLNCKYEKHEISNLINKIDIDKYIHNITKEEILECII